MDSSATREKSPAILMREVALGSMRDPETVLLRDVNWEVQPGEFWVVAGLQGEGKSDLLMMTGGLMPPLEGQYWLFDNPMPMFDEEHLPQRLRLGLTFETGQLFNHLTVRENLALPLRYHRNLSMADVLEPVQQMLQVMELEPWADSTPGALGRNWQKRVGLARALMLKPEILLVDNPLTGLDLRHVYWWLEFLERLWTGKTALHDKPMTVVVTAPDLRPWTERDRSFAIIKNQRMTVLGGRDELRQADRELTDDLLPPESGKG